MSYKTIVVHLDTARRRAERLDIACRLAVTFDAHLVGLFALSAFMVPFAFGGTAGAVIAAEARLRSDATDDARREFEHATSRHGIKAEWRSAEQDALGALRSSARYADLVVIGQDEDVASSDTRLLPHFADEAVMTAGPPVLLVPYAGRFSTVGSRVLVAWNASREAARAVSDALPLLQRARAVEVVAFEARPGAEVAHYLARHGVKVTTAEQRAGIDVGNQILSRAADTSADLIVMGAYGHSRARELVLGGVTRTLLRSMTVPVLMSR